MAAVSRLLLLLLLAVGTAVEVRESESQGLVEKSQSQALEKQKKLFGGLGKMLASAAKAVVSAVKSFASAIISAVKKAAGALFAMFSGLAMMFGLGANKPGAGHTCDPQEYKDPHREMVCVRAPQPPAMVVTPMADSTANLRSGVPLFGAYPVGWSGPDCCKCPPGWVMDQFVTVKSADLTSHRRRLLHVDAGKTVDMVAEEGTLREMTGHDAASERYEKVMVDMSDQKVFDSLTGGREAADRLRVVSNPNKRSLLFLGGLAAAASAGGASAGGKAGGVEWDGVGDPSAAKKSPWDTFRAVMKARQKEKGTRKCTILGLGGVPQPCNVYRMGPKGWQGPDCCPCNEQKKAINPIDEGPFGIGRPDLPGGAKDGHTKWLPAESAKFLDGDGTPLTGNFPSS